MKREDVATVSATPLGALAAGALPTDIPISLTDVQATLESLRPVSFHRLRRCDAAAHMLVHQHSIPGLVAWRGRDWLCGEVAVINMAMTWNNNDCS